MIMEKVLKVDDPLDAVAVHAFCGSWGVLCAGIFAHQPSAHGRHAEALHHISVEQICNCL